MCTYNRTGSCNLTESIQNNACALRALNEVRAHAVSQSVCSAEAPRGSSWLHGKDNAAREPYFRPHFRLRGHVVTHQTGRWDSFPFYVEDRSPIGKLYDEPTAERIG
ncbi:hypothetical protein PHYPO_G00112420 [Pangasianodon hypophthalmus]|uniref:Uncharacterized protein n=1 Tax=Pangasianodon hypophthalmus TaxID=310915 RepID=A0A5N5L2R5_PANHP|nr:hypothetical protein PHYPO_G00112420 [Pangasianodon hypophthalmus]